MSQYEPSFSGVIADTYQESTPAWPSLPEGLNGANVITIVFDDMGEILPNGGVVPWHNPGRVWLPFAA